MPRCRVVTPGVIRLPLSDGDWIDVKKELNAGEAQRVFTNVVKTMHAGEKAELDPRLVGKTKLCEYIVAWSLIDPQGNVLPCDGNQEEHPLSSASLDGIDQDSYAEISAAIDAHEEAIENARAARKNDLAIAKELSVASL